MKCFITTLLLCFLFLVSSYCQNNNDSSLDSLWGIAGSYLVEEEFKDAIPKLRDIENYTSRKKNDYHWALSNIYIAYCFLLENDLDSVQFHTQKVENNKKELLLSKEDNWNITANNNYIIGKYYTEIGWSEQAISHFQKSIDILLGAAKFDTNNNIDYATIGTHFSMNESNLFNDAALAYLSFGDFNKAINYYNIAANLHGLLNGTSVDHKENTRIFSNLGNAYLNLNNLPQGIHFLKKANSFQLDNNQLYNRETKSLIHKNLAYYYLLNEQQDSFQIHIDKGLSFETKDEFKVKVYHVYLQALVSEKSEEKIEIVFDSLYSLADQSIGYFHPDMAKGFKLKGDIYAHQKKHNKAEKYYNTALNILRNKKDDQCNCQDIVIEELNDKRLAMETIHSKALSLSNDHKKNDALICYQLLHQIILELQQKYIMNEESKYFMAQKTKDIYESAIQNSVELDDKESAYQFSQSSRSLILLQQVQDKNAIQATQIPEEILATGQTLKQQINIHLKEKEEALLSDNTQKLEKLEKTLFSLNEQYDKWTSNLESKHPNYYNLKYKLPEISLKALQKKLKEKDATLIEYFMGNEKIYIFVINSNGIQIDVQDINPTFIDNINSVFQNLSQYSWELTSFNSYHQAAYSLFKTLLEVPVANNWLEHKNIVIIPDEQLNLIPFEALTTKPYPTNSTTPQYSKLDYLLFDFNISYLHSSHLINSKKSSNTSNKFLGVAPTFKNPNITPLKNNINEVESINEYYKGETLLGINATYQEFMDEIKNYNIAHFATHAIFNDDIPMDSRIEFSDTSLYIYEIFSLDHQLKLAIMSSCETASGKRKKGEGVISLSRAFIQSGCPSVVASLWEISDNKAVDILSSFHKNLIQNKKRKDESLAEAKREYLSNAINMNTHPFTWAGFIQIGDTSSIHTSSNYFWHWLIGITLLFNLIIIFLKKKK